MKQETNEHPSPTITQVGAAPEENKRRPYSKPERTRISLTQTRLGGSIVVDLGSTGGVTYYGNP